VRGLCPARARLLKRSIMGAHIQRRDSESSVDDLRTKRGVVLGRAVTTLRSVETQPSLGGFVLPLRRASGLEQPNVRDVVAIGESVERKGRMSYKNKPINTV
jgi:hypothetical protein